MSQMRILFAQPPPGERVPICTTDEARIRRIQCPSGCPEMVERIQPIERRTSHNFKLGKSRFFQDRTTYHILKFLAVALARTKYPNNFVDMNELRIFRQGQLVAASYSKPVSDETGVAQRRSDAMRSFYEETDPSKKEEIRERANALENEITPGLQSMPVMLYWEGIGIPHPEANYQVSNGEIVFFEVDQIEPECIFGRARLAGEEQTLAYLANMYAVAVKHWAQNACLGHNDEIGEFRRIAIGELFALVYGTFRTDSTISTRIITNAESYVKTGVAEMKNNLKRKGEKRPNFQPVIVDEKALCPATNLE